LSHKLNLSLELLCSHHSFDDDFTCGNELFDHACRSLLDRVRDRDTDDLLAVVLVDKNSQYCPTDVLGIVSVIDWVAEGEIDADGNMVEGPCLLYGPLALRQDFHGNQLALKMLRQEVREIRTRRFASKDDYVGEVAYPLDGPEGLQRLLERENFRPFQTYPFWWYRSRRGEKRY
jgi:hypothetical protein